MRAIATRLAKEEDMAPVLRTSLPSREGKTFVDRDNQQISPLDLGGIPTFNKPQDIDLLSEPISLSNQFQITKISNITV